MKCQVGIVVIASACLFLSACNYQAPLVVGSGVLSSYSYGQTGFDRLVIDDGVDVTILQGDGYAVEVSADDNVIDKIDVSQRSDQLRIGFAHPMRLRNATLMCVVHMPRLSKAKVTGTSHLTLRSIASNDLSLDVSGASQVDGEAFGGRIKVTASGASHVKLTGEASELDIQASGASRANLQQVVASGNSTVNASGASVVTLQTSGQLSMDASGASSIYYAGSPSLLKRSTSGASSIMPKSFDD